MKGHVKWVCIDHYRENYQSKAVKAAWGSFDENVGRVEVKIQSNVQADQFYSALEYAKSVYELRIELEWDPTYSDFMRLRDTLSTTNIGALALDLGFCEAHVMSTDILNRGRRYDPIFDIMRHPSIWSFEIHNAPPDLFQRSSLLSRDDFSHLRHLRISERQLRNGDKLKMEEEILSLKCLLANAPNLTSLALPSTWESLPVVYSSVVGYQTYPIDFYDEYMTPILRILPPPIDSPQSKISLQNLDQLFEIHGGRIETFYFEREPRGSVLDALAEATQSGSRLKELNTRFFQRKEGDDCIENLVSIVSRSELRKLDLASLNDAEYARIVESIQWKHLRELYIELDDISQWSTIKALVDGVRRTSERVELERFTLQSENSTTSASQKELLRYNLG
ncbi:hypothetical protein BGZ65_009247 [Modicella reniformis]|uniref:Uncharacterized protein n=1 Tax=Modicella reniformis TaxID=1440133 RepID=A0A9P6J4J1_9FUNG|nr:hypothetical protein BGZ65_009247 [Modicella reniformis]